MKQLKVAAVSGWFLLFAVIATAFGGAVPPVFADTLGAVSQVAPRNLAALVDDPLVADSYGALPNGGVRPNGAAGSNAKFDDGKQDTFHIDEQRLVGEFVTVGLIRNRPDLVDKGWKAVAWALQHQNADGSFGGADSVHGSSMFLEGALRALSLELEMGKPSSGAPYLQKLILGVRSLAARNPDKDPELLRSAPLTHRYWIKAALMAEASELAADDSLAATAAMYARRAMAAQLPDGVNPERGGYDVGYHATGLVYAVRYHVNCNDPTLQRAVAGSIDRGLAWLSTRIAADGSVNASGSTRIGVEHNWAGKLKGVPYGLVAEAFASGAVLLNEPAYQDIARRIMNSSGFKSYYRGPGVAPARVLDSGDQLKPAETALH